MKCLLIASESAEVLFHWTDLEYQRNIQEQYGASQEEGEELPAFEDILSTLFAPIIISYSTMEDSYTSFTTDNNHIYVLHQFDECLYIAVNGDGEEKEDDLRRKMYVMKKMIECIEFLERRLVQQLNSSVERAGEEVLHAFILVHTKLLAFYSSRNASILTTSDLLALIIMAQNMYPSNVDLDDQSPEDVESTSGSGPESFYTPEPSPSSRDSGSSDRPDRRGTPVFEFVDPDIQMAEDSLHALEISPPDPSTPRRVFLDISLKDGLYPMMPHSMYCLPLWPGITLVLLTKIPTSAVALSVYKYLEDFDKLEKRLREGQGSSAAARSPLNMQDVRCKLDKFVKALGPSELQSAQLQIVWTEFKNRAFAKNGPGFNKDLIPWCKKMKTQLCGIYRQCFLIDSTDFPQRLSPGLQEGAQAMMQEKLMDWKDFLLVKSKRNITMVSYLEDFPGLVHFICVDRSSGQMIAPSLSITERTTSELGKGPVARFIKSKRLLRYYSKNHKGETVKCYELLTVHLGVIPTEIILQHCRQLASKLWEPSRNPLL
uniref:Hermansky-Pudlak syndrome 1 n=1 Tax=Nothobranchius furzeri TaxID=105023 RepID=A0A1A8USN5_NOTFU